MDTTPPDYTNGIIIHPLDLEITTLTHITTNDTSPLWGMSLTHVTPSQQHVNKTSILTSLVAHMYIRGALLGCSIPFPSSQVASSDTGLGHMIGTLFFHLPVK
jgi:hypothetical protein